MKIIFTTEENLQLTGGEPASSSVRRRRPLSSFGGPVAGVRVLAHMLLLKG